MAVPVRGCEADARAVVRQRPTLVRAGSTLPGYPEYLSFSNHLCCLNPLNHRHAVAVVRALAWLAVAARGPGTRIRV